MSALRTLRIAVEEGYRPSGELTRRRRVAKQAESVGLRPRPETAMPWNRMDEPMRLFLCDSVKLALQEEGASDGR